MRKIFEVASSFLLFGSGATALVMIWVLVADYKLAQWAISPPALLVVCAVVFFLALAGHYVLKGSWKN